MRRLIPILLSIVFLSVGIFFFSFAMNQYQVKTGSRASTSNWNQCDAAGSNKPCGSCNITEITAQSNGDIKAKFGCQLLCESGNCPSGTYLVDDTSWFWCRNREGSSCTEGSFDLVSNAHNTTSVGSLTISDSSSNATNNNMSWDFSIPNWEGCGRIQVDVKINAQGVNHAGLTTGFGENCAEEPTGTPTTAPPTNTPGATNTQTPPINTPTSVPPTNPPTTAPTHTQTPPTNTPTTAPPTNTPTTAPTNTQTPTPTKTPTVAPPTFTPTFTPTLTHTPTPTNTPTSAPTNTATPTPTHTIVPTWTPVPTWTVVPTQTPIPPTKTPKPTKIPQLAVNDQPPGFNPWIALLIPFALVIAGLAL